MIKSRDQNNQTKEQMSPSNIKKPMVIVSNRSAAIDKIIEGNEEIRKQDTISQLHAMHSYNKKNEEDVKL